MWFHAAVWRSAASGPPQAERHADRGDGRHAAGTTFHCRGPAARSRYHQTWTHTHRHDWTNTANRFLFTNVNMLGGDFCAATQCVPPHGKAEHEMMFTFWQICQNVNINVSRKHKHTGLTKEICLLSANVLRGRTLWRRKRSDWPQSLKKRLALCVTCWSRLSLAGFSPPLMNYCCSHRLYSTRILAFFNLGKAVCLIEIGYCRIFNNLQWSHL